MIQSYRDKRTKEFAEGERVKEFEGFRRQAEKRLYILDAATSLADLQALPSNALEGMKGDRKGQYSIRINIVADLFRMARGAERTLVRRNRGLPLKGT